MPYYLKIPYVRCECGFRTDNTELDHPRIAAGDYCPRCGEKLTEYNELHRQSMATPGDRDRRDSSRRTGMSRAQKAGQAVGMAIALGVMYIVMRVGLPTGAEMTINGETMPLFPPSLLNAAFGFVVVVVAVVLFGPDLYRLATKRTSGVAA